MSPTQTVRFIRDANGARVAYAKVGEGPLILDQDAPSAVDFFGLLVKVD